MLCTIREAGEFDFDEKVFRAWTAGEGVACRLPTRNPYFDAGRVGVWKVLGDELNKDSPHWQYRRAQLHQALDWD